MLDGVRVIPESVYEMEDALLSSAELTGPRRMGWYEGQDRFEAFGATGCYCVGLPSLEAVAVRMCNRYEAAADGDWEERMVTAVSETLLARS